VKSLVVFPGLSSPYHERYTSVYDLLRDEGKKRAVNIHIVTYPGQVDSEGNYSGELSPQGAVGQAKTILQQMEKDNEEYRTLGISFGCFVSLAAAMKLSGKHFWKSMALWGLIPFWMNWESFASGKRNENIGKGTRFIDSNTFYSQLMPNELMLTMIDVPFSIGVGSKDKYVLPEYLSYLRGVLEGNSKASFSLIYIEGCEHNVKSGQINSSRYLDWIFSQ